MKKKSYMRVNKILSEGFFDKIRKMFGGGVYKKLESDKTFQDSLKDLNKSVVNIEKRFETAYGKKLKLNKFTLSDFI